ncbi:MAG: hypothetical protein RR131_10010, partial [Anaerovorax sp.]
TNFFTVKNDGWDLDALKATTFVPITDFKNSSQGAIMIPMYIRSTEEMDVYLKVTDATATASALCADDGGNITTALRVAVVDGATKTIFETNPAKDKVLTRKNTTMQGTKAETNEAVTAIGGTVSPQSAVDPKGYMLVDLNKNNVVDKGDTVPANKLFTTNSNNTPKLIYVYIWLEGCDWDCVSEVSKDKYKVNLNFIGAPKGTQSGSIS